MDRSANMRAIRSKDMRPELKVRSLAHRLGYRFRLHPKNLQGYQSPSRRWMESPHYLGMRDAR
jgi:G:T-mismatch repair DNA endonuclease (very short patch repair protein)